MIEPLVAERGFELKWRFGLRTAMLVHKLASRHAASLELSWNGQRADAKNLIALVCLGTVRSSVFGAAAVGPLPGDRVTLSAAGPDAAPALAALSDLFAYGRRVDRCPHAGCASVPVLSGLDETRAEYSCAQLHLWTVERATGRVFAD